MQRKPEKENGAAVRRIIRKRREEALIRKGYVQLFTQIIVILLVVWMLFSQVFLVTRVSGQEMFPAVKDGDLVLAYRLQGTYVKGDVVVYTVDGKAKTGRIAARWGDVVAMDDTGSLLVNGTVQSGEIVYPTYAKDALEYPYTVPDRCVFILGDYRTQSEDSRDFGAVSLDNVKGKVITILRRRGL